jgi:hypothetical protein
VEGEEGDGARTGRRKLTDRGKEEKREKVGVGVGEGWGGC